MTCESEQTGAVVQTVLKNEETEKVKEKIEEMIEREGGKGVKEMEEDEEEENKMDECSICFCWRWQVVLNLLLPALALAPN